MPLVYGTQNGMNFAYYVVSERKTVYHQTCVKEGFPLKKITIINISKALQQNNLMLCGFITLSIMLVHAIGAEARGFGLVKDIRTGNYSSNIDYMRTGNTIFFWAEDAYGSASREMWTSNGSTDGTRKISTFNRDVYLDLGKSTDIAVGQNYFFTLRNQDNDQYELWKSDSIGVQKLKDIPDYLDNRYYPAGSGDLFFFVPWSDPVYGRELWVSDGTTSGTMRITDINPGTGDSSPHDLTDVNGVLYFLVGNNIWKSDGTGSGTSQVFNFDGTETASTDIVAVVNDTLYIRRSLSISPYNVELWRHEATLAQTSKVIAFTNLPTALSCYAGVGNTLYFVNNTAESPDNKYGLWKTDGTESGTSLLKEWLGVYSTSSLLTNADNLLFFRGGDDSNRELWMSDGTSAGTVQVKDINNNEYSSDIYCPTALGKSLFFIQKQTDYVSSLWMSDGSEAGIVQTDFTANFLKCPVVLNNKLYFYGNDSTNSDYGAELYRFNPSHSMPIVPVVMLLLGQ